METVTVQGHQPLSGLMSGEWFVRFADFSKAHEGLRVYCLDPQRRAGVVRPHIGGGPREWVDMSPETMVVRIR